MGTRNRAGTAGAALAVAALLAAGGHWGGIGAARAQTAAAPGGIGGEAVRAGTTAALGRLCGAGTADASGTAATIYCHGFLAGVAQFHRELTRDGGPVAPLYCPPEPPPTLDAVAAGFAAWTRANPQHGAEPAVDGLARYAGATYPCPARPAASPGRGGGRGR